MKRLEVALCCSVVCLGSLSAQTNGDKEPTWQEAAGGAMAFEVASIREDKGPFRPPSFALSADDSFQDPMGRFFADFPLSVYIEFANKVWLTNEERRSMLANLPEWVRTDRFAIQATAPLHVTKDQYRLMMQALLAERFGLKLHVEHNEMPVLAMTLIKPGKPGPKLIPHDHGQACDEAPKPETFPKDCYSYSAEPAKDGTILFGSRATSMSQIANFVGSVPGSSSEIGRRVVDQTALTGLWDYTLQMSMPRRNSTSQEVASEGPSVFEALGDQLGIKLKSAKAVVPVLIVDHVERPSEN
jgi:uncharacterized protein (TIGR03435 family)